MSVITLETRTLARARPCSVWTCLFCVSGQGLLLGRNNFCCPWGGRKSFCFTLTHYWMLGSGRLRLCLRRRRRRRRSCCCYASPWWTCLDQDKSGVRTVDRLPLGGFSVGLLRDHRHHHTMVPPEGVWRFVWLAWGRYDASKWHKCGREWQLRRLLLCRVDQYWPCVVRFDLSIGSVPPHARALPVSSDTSVIKSRH